jgi:hypothetical protein
VERQLLQGREAAGPSGLKFLREWTHGNQYGWGIKVRLAHEQTYFAALNVNEKATVCQ